MIALSHAMYFRWPWESDDILKWQGSKYVKGWEKGQRDTLALPFYGVSAISSVLRSISLFSMRNKHVGLDFHTV